MSWLSVGVVVGGLLSFVGLAWLLALDQIQESNPSSRRPARRNRIVSRSLTIVHQAGVLRLLYR